MTDKKFVLSCGPRVLRLALVAALATLVLGLAGEAGAHKPVPLSAPTIGANPVVGTPLGVAPGSYFCDPACTGTTYEFFRCAANSNTVSCVAVRPQSTNPFYTPTEDDIGFSLAAMVRQWTYDCNIKNEDCRNSAYEVMTSATAPVKEDAPPVPVTIATSELPDATAGIRYTQGLSLSSGRPPFTWALAGGSLPPGLSLSSGGLISGTPTLAGVFNFTVRATGARRQSNTKSLTLLVKLQLSPSKLPNGVAGTAYNVRLAVVAGGTPPYTWEIEGGLLPDGLTLSPNGVLSGTPTRGGPSTFMVGIADARGATASFVWTLVVDWVRISVTPTTLPSGRSGVPYRAALGATGGRPPYRFLLVSERPLPEGLTLSREGVLAGTPTAPAGVYTFTILVADATGAPGSITYTLTLAASQRLRATTLAAATVGKRYRTTLPMTGGQRPYSFSRTGGRLPAGVRLSSSGVLLGKPMIAGRFRFSVRARDRNGFSRPRLYALVVKGK
jgi:hypothetical protein